MSGLDENNPIIVWEKVEFGEGYVPTSFDDETAMLDHVRRNVRRDFVVAKDMKVKLVVTVNGSPTGRNTMGWDD